MILRHLPDLDAAAAQPLANADASGAFLVPGVEIDTWKIAALRDVIADGLVRNLFGRLPRKTASEVV